MPEIRAGDDISAIIDSCCKREQILLENHDVVLVTSKILSKSENNVVDLSTVIPSKKARSISRLTGKDPIEVEIILSQTRAIRAVIPIKKVMERYPEVFENFSTDRESMIRSVNKVPAMLVTVTNQGLVATDAGLDYSNNPPGKASLLPKNSDASAKRIRDELCRLTGKDVSIIITDTEIAFTNFYGSTEVAIGHSGIRPVSNKFGSKDRFGTEKFGGADVIVDELACAAALISGQTSESIPIVIVRGLEYESDDHMKGKLFQKEAMSIGIGQTILSTLKLRLFSRLLEVFS